MCGRYFVDPELILEQMAQVMGPELDFELPDGFVQPLDIRPRNDAPALVRQGDGLALERMNWGFDKPGGGLVINARAETIDSRPMFRPLAQRQRCALPASTYYEWRRSDGQKYTVGLGDAQMFFLAGLYRIGERGREFVVLTQPPVAAIEPVHNRMPLLLDTRQALLGWLGGERPYFADSARLRVAAEGPEQLSMLF